MQLGTVGSYPITIGWLIALVVLVVVVVMWAIGQLEPRLALLFGALAVSRLT